MKRLLVLLWLLGMQTSCRFPGNGPQKIKFYHRDRLGDGEVYTYSDYLAISSYESKPATARQLLQVAIHIWIQPVQNGLLTGSPLWQKTLKRQNLFGIPKYSVKKGNIF